MKRKKQYQMEQSAIDKQLFQVQMKKDAKTQENDMNRKEMLERMKYKHKQEEDKAKAILNAAKEVAKSHQTIVEM